MQENPQHFNKLLGLLLMRPLTLNLINLSLKNNNGQTLYDLPYLNHHRRHCIYIAGRIQQAQKLWLKMNETENGERAELFNFLQNSDEVIASCLTVSGCGQLTICPTGQA